jgi:hypothetical protein
LSLRVKLYLVCILLCLAISATVVAASAAFQDMQRFQQQNAMAISGDVRTIHPWMTIPYIAHLYHIPESYLYRSLQIADTPLLRHVTLHALASRSQRPVNAMIRTLQHAIQTYRQQHPRKHTIFKRASSISIAGIDELALIRYRSTGRAGR